MPVPESPDELVELIRADVTAMFGDAFPGRFDIPGPLGEQLPIGSGDATTVPWRWRGRHEGVFHEVRPTGFEVEVVGVTILVAGDGEPLHHRIVDWLTLYRQLGLSMVCRRPQTPDTADVDDADIARVHGASLDPPLT